MILLIILGSVVVVTIIIYAIWYFNRKRTKTLRLVAESLNFTFSEKGDKPLMDSLSGFDLFSDTAVRRNRYNQFHSVSVLRELRPFDNG